MFPARLDEALELADLLRPSWAPMQHALRESGVPLNDEPTPDPAPAPDPDPKPDPDPTPAPDPKPDPAPDPAAVSMPKDEAERLRRLDRQEKDRQRKAQEEAGKHAEIVQQVEKERDEKDTELETLRAERATEQNQSAVRSVAGRLNFHDAEDAVLRTPDEVAAKGDSAIEAHLKGLAKKSPHLVGTGKPRNSASVDPNGGGSEGEQLTSTEGMTPEQIVKAQEEGRLDDYLKSK